MGKRSKKTDEVDSKPAKRKSRKGRAKADDDGLLVGLDIGGTKLYAVVADSSGAVRGSARKKTRPQLGFEGVMGRALEVVAEACEDAKVPLEALRGVGVGAPSPMLPDGTAVNAPNLGWRNAPVGALLEGQLSRPVITANDCDAGTFGELVYGAGAGADTLVGLFMGTGLGGGIVIDGKPVCGENNMAAEIGHMVVVADGRRCGCGHRGCLEAYASKTGMGSYLRCQVACEGRETVLTELCDGDFGSLRSGALAKAYAEQDELAVEALHESARFLGIGVANLVTLLGPSVVVLGGGVMEALGKQLLPHVERAARASAFPPGTLKKTKICLAALGDDSVALGAVAWARQRLL
jgi:glucokinase